LRSSIYLTAENAKSAKACISIFAAFAAFAVDDTLERGLVLAAGPADRGALLIDVMPAQIDSFTPYEIALHALCERLGPDHPRSIDALTFQARLLENISQARRYGDTGALRADRAQIRDQLNRLALETVGVSFNDLLPPSDVLETAAARQLDTLPLHTIPAPAPLPPGSRMPLSRNPLFVGREADLKQLAAALKAGATAAIGQIAATGLGGIGKTHPTHYPSYSTITV
jgi:hypothetical protein